MLNSCMLFMLLQVICVGALFMVQTSFDHGFSSFFWVEEACLMKMVFCKFFHVKLHEKFNLK
jgi:hypothetical protein